MLAGFGVRRGMVGIGVVIVLRVVVTRPLAAVVSRHRRDRVDQLQGHGDLELETPGQTQTRDRSGPGITGPLRELGWILVAQQRRRDDLEQSRHVQEEEITRARRKRESPGKSGA